MQCVDLGNVVIERLDLVQLRALGFEASDQRPAVSGQRSAVWRAVGRR